MNKYLPYLIIALLFFFCTTPGRNLLRALLGQGRDPAKLPYHTKFILTGPEYKFYMAIKPLMDELSYTICPKVGLKDLFEVNAGTQDRQKYFGKISQKHIDFLVCDDSLRPLFAVELDDKSHRRSDVQERDAFKNLVFQSANFPLYRVPTNSFYTKEYLRQYLPCLATEAAAAAVVTDTSIPSGKEQ